MNKKSGLFAFAAGLAAGAAALFLSDEDNREKTKKAVKDTKKKAEAEVKKAAKVTKKTVEQAKKEVKKVAKTVKKPVKTATVKSAKKTSK